jgi:ABC-type Fe3+-hydroxamate transport system substrate-binding protein
MRAVEEAINRLSEYGCGTSSPQRQAERKHELHRLLLLLAEAGSPMRQSPAEETTGMERALAYLQQNFAKDIKVDQLARMAGLSTNHFLRTFKYRMDMTPMEYVRKQRMTEAKKRLFSSDTIKEVARQVGYPDEHYFSRVFKKAEGVAPTLYMKSSSRRIAALYYGLDDYLITLGHGPVAALSYEERVSRSYPVPSLSEHNPAVVLDLPTLNYDKLIRSKPDLILTSDRVERDAALDRIAPTLLLKHSNDYEKVLGHIADVLGKERQAAAWVDHFSERKHSLQRKIRSRWGQPTVYYIRVSPTFYRIYGAMNQTGSLLYRDLGLRLPEAFPSRQWAIDFQLRDLALLNADHIFLMADPTDLARRQLQLLLQSEQWLALDAVKHRRVHDASDLLFKALGPTGRSWAMERIARQLGVEPG